ncbi:MAG: hypothetical protein ACXWE0_07505 [Nitrososphaeraceae archaeon]
MVSRKSYSTIASSIFDYIEKKLGKEGVMDLLGERQAQLFLQYNQRLNCLEFDDKIKESAKIRDEEGVYDRIKKNE